MFRKLYLINFLLLFLALAMPVLAQEAADTETTDESADTEIDTDIAIWWNEFQDESSKAEEYGELPEGFLINRLKADFAFKDDRFIEVAATNVGLNNARYSFNYGVEGDYNFFLNYKKIPHLFTREGETIWTETSPGVWTLSDALQQAVQNINPVDPTDPTYAAGLTNQRLFVGNLLNEAHDQFLGLQRNRTDAGFRQNLTDNFSYKFLYELENRDGYRPFGTSFGFSWATELPESIDYATQHFHVSSEYSGTGKTLTFAYDLRLFDNDLSALVWDNPLRFTDRTFSTAYTNGDGTSRAQMQLPEDNTSNTISVGGAANVGSGRVTGTFAYSLWTDEVDLLPFTVNTSIPVIPLPANQFNGDQTNLNINLRYTTPFASKGDFTASYRLYDHNNNNDVFNIGEYVRFDQVIEELTRYECDPAANICNPIANPPTPLFEYSNNTFSLDAGWRLGDKYRAFVGYQFERWNREHRDTEETDTNRIRVGLDANATDWATIRVSYQRASRRSDFFEVDSPTYLVIPLRRADVANLDQNLFRVIADFSPSEKTTVGFSFLLTNNEYPDTLFGLQKWDEYSVGADISYAVAANSSLNAWYEHAEIDRDQAGRQSGATPSTTPNFDWFVNTIDKYDTVGAGYSTAFSGGKTIWDVNLSYAFANGNADIAAGAAVRPTGPGDINDFDDTDLFSVRTGLNCKVFPRTRFGLFYWYEQYNIDDFAENSIATNLIFLPNPIGGTPLVGGAITLNAVQPDYQFHSGWVGFIFNW